MQVWGKGRSWMTLVVVVVGGMMTLPATAQESSSTARAEVLIQQGRWAEAEAAFEAIVAGEPDNGAAWYMLGYARYSQQQWDDALDAWEKTVALGYREADTLYGKACVLSLAGRVEEAVKAFAAALEAGFNDHYLIADDSDLDNIRQHPRFRELFTPPPPYEPHPDAVQVEFTTAAGAKVFGELYRAAADAPETPVVLLLHQAGSNSAEYQPIAPRLAAAGFHALAIDERGGGRRFGRDNRTVAARGGPAQYAEAIEDTLAAVGWLRSHGYTGPLTVWGSSYSASNTIRLLVEARGVFVAGLAFSPGNPLADDGKPFAPRVARPILVTWPEHEWGPEQEALFAALGGSDKVLVEQTGGRHGSSTLFPDLNPAADRIWEKVLSFLDRHGR